MLAKSKLNRTETLVSQALTDMEISHEEFITILKEKDKYEKIRIERQIIAIMMKIFAKESMTRQYKTDGLCYDVDFCFLVYKLEIEVAENRHIYYDEEKHKIRQKLIVNLGFNFIRISPDVEKFDLDVEIAKIYNYINKSSVRIPVNLAENL